MTSPKVWRGQTLEVRSVDRRTQLIQAGFELLGDHGASGLTMRAACRTAGLSLRYFYESFSNREQLVMAVYDAISDELRDRVGSVDSSGDLESTIRTALDECATFFEEDPRRARVLLREPLADDTLRAHSSQQVPIFVLSVAAMLGSGREALSITSESTLAMSASALSGALASLFLDWSDGHLEVSKAEVAEFAGDLVFRTLTKG